ncbi:MAG: tryptophan synthase subunit alpha [Clostridiales bacterium]|jgi:tryptophan synthase alpha chain|nr:tryptophan synthase subunit alpha [Clostridiales bacterium]
MSERIRNAFKKSNAFIGFLTCGDPSVKKSLEFAERLIEGGIDLLEIGIPFSDPIAEGEVIQKANIRALSAGTRVEDSFTLAKEIRVRSGIPLVFLTYLNPVFAYGYDAFFKRCKDCGVDGVIIPDMPFEEQGEALPFADRHGADIISLVAPTSKRRVCEIAAKARGFLYVVSSMGVTGMRKEISTDLKSIISEAKRVTDIPIAVGFGISSKEQAREISELADGVIIGSAIVKIIEKYGEDAGKYLYEFAREVSEEIKTRI